jgi:DNA-binding transcriptional LysR family regulator
MMILLVMRIQHRRLAVDIENVRAFLAVVDDGHFGAAADRLQVPQPTLSRRIQRLENEVGHQLLIRTARPVMPSPAGRLLAVHARAMVEAADRAAAALHALADGRRVAVRIGYVQSATFRWVPRLLEIARERNMELGLVAAPTVRQIEALRDHRLDAGLIRPTSTTGGITDLHTATLCRDELQAVLADTHPLVGRRYLRPTHLSNQPLVLYPEREGPGLRHLITRWLDACGTGAPTIHDAWDAPSAAVLAAAGAGIAILPDPLPPLPSGAQARPLHRSPRLDLALAWHPAAERVIQPVARLLTSQETTPDNSHYRK